MDATDDSPGRARDVLARRARRAPQAAGLFKEERYIHSPQGAEIEVEFPAGAPPKKVINLCANNYLGLSTHPDVVAAAHAGLDEPRLRHVVRALHLRHAGHPPRARETPDRSSSAPRTRFSSPPASTRTPASSRRSCPTEDVMIADRLVHASIVDGMRLCKAMQDTYKHSDMGHLEEKLAEHKDKRFRLIITDGVFSMDGDLAKLDEIVALAEKYDAMVFVDDSHATGFIGKTGRGTHEHFGVLGKIDVITTTLGKALGGASGGCVSGRREIVEMCRQRARPYLFSNTLAPGHRGRRRSRCSTSSPRRPSGATQLEANAHVLAAAPDRGRLRHQGRREPDRPGHALQREARAGRRARPVRRRASTSSASSSRSSRRDRPASGRSSRPRTRRSTSTGPSRPSGRSGRSTTSSARRRTRSSRRYGL